MIVLFFGPQGSGKGTQAKIIAEKIGVPHISSGDLLRGVGGPLKLEIESYTNHGKLVPDKLILKILKERIAREDCKGGYILEGFPRNLKQARALNKFVKVDRVIEIAISDEEAIGRISSRVSCSRCGSVYNLVTSPPKKKGICDKDGEKLFVRDDDKEKAIRNRLDTYHKETEAILKLYPYTRINGEQGIVMVTKDILKALGQKYNV